MAVNIMCFRELHSLGPAFPRFIFNYNGPARRLQAFLNYFLIS